MSRQGQGGQSDSDDDSDSNLSDVPLIMQADSEEDENHARHARSPHPLSSAMPDLRLDDLPHRKLTKEATFSKASQEPSNGNEFDLQPLPTPRGGPAGPPSSITFERQGSAPRAALKPPRLMLPSAAGASPAASPTVSTTFLDLPVPSHSPTARHQQKHKIQLISQAFVVNRAALSKAAEQGLGLREVIERRCMTGLGVNAEELQFYELRPISSYDIAECSTIGVEINDSSFSLSSLEELLADKARLLMMNEKNSTTLANIHNDYREARHEIARLQLKAVEHEADSKRWQQRCKALEQENEHLRQKLAASDEARVQAFNTVTELRREFDIMKASYERDRLGNAQGPHGALRSHSTANAYPEGLRTPFLLKSMTPMPGGSCAQQEIKESRQAERIGVESTSRVEELAGRTERPDV